MNSRNLWSTADHLAKRDLRNGKPFRTAAQRIAARASARLVNGRFVSTAPVSFHAARDSRPA